MKHQANKRSIAIYGIVTALLIVFHYALNFIIFGSWQEYIPFLKKLSLSLFLITLILFFSKIIENRVNKQNQLEEIVITLSEL